jgi:hypothetical protein
MGDKKYVVFVIMANILIVLGLLAVIIISGVDYHELLLMDDGYYEIARDFAHGDTLLHRFRGPVLPLILSTLFIFPKSAHALVRLLISLLFSAGTIVVLFRITKDYIPRKAFFLGSLVFVLNPVYVHWIIRSCPEIYLAFFLGLFIMNIIDYYTTRRITYLVFASATFAISFCIKPVFLFIPILLLISAMLIRSRRMIIVSLFLLTLGFLSYGAQNEFTEIQYNPEASKFERKNDWVHQTLLISDSYWVDYVLKTKQFHKPTVNEYKIEYRDGKSLVEYRDDWIKVFYEKYPEGNLAFMHLYFISTEPLLVLQKLIVSPIFYFSMSARSIETFVKLIFSILSIFLSVLGLRVVCRNSQHKNSIILIVSIVAGFASLHLLTHAMNRYSLPILPYLYVWGGIPLMKFRNQLSELSRQRARGVGENE